MSAGKLYRRISQGQTICSQGDAGKECSTSRKGTSNSRLSRSAVSRRLAIMHRGNYLGAEWHDRSSIANRYRYRTYTMYPPVIAKKEMTRALHNGHESQTIFIGCLLGRNIRIERI